MAKKEQFDILKKGVEAWNEWRSENPFERIDLSKANLSEANLVNINFKEANLSNATLNGANLNHANLSRSILIDASLAGINLRNANIRRSNLRGANIMRSDLSGTDLIGAKLIMADLRESTIANADLRWANLTYANLSWANLYGANLTQADLWCAYFSGANLSKTDLRAADLSKSNLSSSILVEANLENAIIVDCNVYGISAWGVRLEGSIQKDLIITRDDESLVTVDNLEVAQFIYIFLHNKKIRQVIDTITSKVVLILGRFTPERKEILDTIKDELRIRGYLPVLFDFNKPKNRDLTETISILAHMAKFIIADITDAKAVPIELEHIVPLLPSVPVQPIIIHSEYEYALIDHIMGFRSVLETYRYENQKELIASLKEKVIEPAEAKVNALRRPN